MCVCFVTYLPSLRCLLKIGYLGKSNQSYFKIYYLLKIRFFMIMAKKLSIKIFFSVKEYFLYFIKKNMQFTNLVTSIHILLLMSFLLYLISLYSQLKRLKLKERAIGNTNIFLEVTLSSPLHFLYFPKLIFKFFRFVMHVRYTIRRR